MAVDVARLAVVVEADTHDVEAGLRRTHEGISSLASHFGVGAAAGAAFGAGMLGINAAMGALKGGFQAVIGSGIGLNTSMENVSARLNAMTKDGAASAKILADIRKEADQTPFAFNEMADATASLLPVAKSSGNALMDLVKQAEVLAAVRPDQGLAGAAMALREATSGDFTSIVERFDLPRQRLNELKAQGVPALKAVQIAMKEMGLDGQLVANMAQTMTGRWSTFQDTVAGIQGKLTSGLFDGLKTGLEGLQTIFDDNKDAIDGFATSVGQAIGSFVSDAIPKLLAFGRTAIPAIVGAFSTLKTAVADVATVVGPIVERITTLWSSLASGQTLATTINRAFGDLIPPELNTILDAVDVAFKTVKDTLAGLIPVVQGFVSNRLDAALELTRGAVAAVAQVLQGDFMGALTTAAGAVGTWVDGLRRDLAPLGERVAEMIAAAVPQIGAKLTEWATAFGAWVKPAVASFLDAWPGMLSGAFDAIEAAAPGIAEKLGQWAVEFAEWIPPAIAVMVPALAGVAGALAVFVAETAVVIGQRLVKWGGLFVDWVAETVLPRLPGALGAIADAIGGFISDTAASVGAGAAAIGRSIVDGIAAGVRGAAGSLIGALRDLGNQLPDPVKKAIGFGSPAKVFIEVGASIVDGLRIGLTSSLGALDTAFQQLTQLARHAAASVKGPIDELIGYLKRGGSPEGKDISGGYIGGFLRSVNAETAQRLGDTLRGYFDEYLDKLGTLADAAVPAVQRVREDLAQGLSDAVASATRSAQDAVSQAAGQIQDAIASLAESRDIGGRRSAFASGQSAASLARQQAREDAEAQYQLQRDLAKATSDQQRDQILARFKDSEAERAHRRQLDAEDRAFADQQARERQAFEDQLADEGLAKQIKRIEQERDARLKAVQDELAAREAGLVQSAQTGLQRVIQQVNDAINASIGQLFDNLPEEMRKRGGPTDPAFLGAVRNDVSGLIVPIAGMIQSLLANLAGIPNTYGPGVSLPALPPGGAFSLPMLPAAAPAPAPPVIIQVSGSFLGTAAEAARVLAPELARLGR